MTAYVVVQCKRSVAVALSGSGTARAPSRSILGTIEKLQGRVLPSMAPAAAQDAESVFVTIEVPDFDRANELAAALRAIRGIEAAYAKPGESLP